MWAQELNLVGKDQMVRLLMSNIGSIAEALVRLLMSNIGSIAEALNLSKMVGFPSSFVGQGTQVLYVEMGTRLRTDTPNMDSARIVSGLLHLLCPAAEVCPLAGLQLRKLGTPRFDTGQLPPECGPKPVCLVFLDTRVPVIPQVYYTESTLCRAARLCS